MAIKGKKRSRSRGSQGARRPAHAPRPTPSGIRRHKPWYRSPLGIGMIVIFALVGIGLIIWAIVSAQERAQELEDRQTVLDQYTDQVRGTLQPTSEPVGAMAELTPPLNAAALRGLPEDADRWATSLQEVQGALAQMIPAEETQAVTELFNESISLYVTAASTFRQLPDIADESAREAVSTQAANLRDTATAVFQSAVRVLDQLRDDAELGASAIQPPVSPNTQPAPLPTDGGSTTIEVPTDGGDDGGG